MNSWISADLEHNPGTGLTGKLGALGGIQNWTSTATDCCNIGDMDVGDDVDLEVALDTVALDLDGADPKLAQDVRVQALRGGLRV